MVEFDVLPTSLTLSAGHPGGPARGTGVAWIGLDLGASDDEHDVERRVLSALDDLDDLDEPGAPVDLVVLHELAGVVSRVVAVLRTPEVGQARSLAKELYVRLGGTAVTLTDSGDRQVAVVLGHRESATDCLSAVRTSQNGLAGRCVRFPGQSRLFGVAPAQRLVDRTAITRVVDAVGEPASSEALVDLSEAFRPVFEDGHLVLRVAKGRAGHLVALVDG